METHIDPREEWQQIFNDAWRFRKALTTYMTVCRTVSLITVPMGRMKYRVFMKIVHQNAKA
jgi:hypothetical protein